LTLTLAGQGSMRAELERLAQLLKVADNVRFVGQLEHEKIYPFLGGHHLMIMPSRSESFGVAALEAAACARPVIASKVGGIPEVVIDGQTGILVPPDDETALTNGIIKMARDQASGRQLGLNGYRMVQEKFSWSESLDRMTALYQSLA